MSDVISDEQINQIRESLRTELNIDLSNSLSDQLSSQNEELRSQILELRQALQMNMPHHDDEDNMDILVNQHMRDITRENRPQMSAAGLEINNKNFKDLSNSILKRDDVCNNSKLYFREYLLSLLYYV